MFRCHLFFFFPPPPLPFPRIKRKNENLYYTALSLPKYQFEIRLFSPLSMKIKLGVIQQPTFALVKFILSSLFPSLSGT